jgi:hypothetical protein
MVFGVRMQRFEATADDIFLQELKVRKLKDEIERV